MKQFHGNRSALFEKSERQTHRQTDTATLYIYIDVSLVEIRSVTSDIRRLKEKEKNTAVKYNPCGLKRQVKQRACFE